MKNNSAKHLTPLAAIAYSRAVKKKRYSLEEVVAMMKRKQGDRSLREYAKEIGVSAPYLSDIYMGRRSPGEAILKPMGLQVRREVQVIFETL